MDSVTAAKVQKPKFWRIRGIEAASRTVALSLLAKHISVADHGSRRIVPTDLSAVAHFKEYWVAIVTSAEKPTISDVPWQVDQDFYGVTPISNPDNAVIDLVVVPGLGGHPLGSFRSKDGKVVWLRNFLPMDLPLARILVYGYDTNIATTTDKSSIGELARKFLDSLCAFRSWSETVRRPVCFLAHSLGGIVVKTALGIANTNAIVQQATDLLLSTHGLMFFGVPNLGLRNEQLLSIIQDQPNTELVRSLVTDSDSEPSAYLNELTRKFRRTCEDVRPSFEIISYYERKASPTVELVDGVVRHSQEKVLLVTQASAEAIGPYTRDIEHIPMDANHRDLVRFESRFDSEYMSVCDKLSQMTTKAPFTTSQRFAGVQDFTGEQQLAWNKLNRPPYDEFRRSEKLVQPDPGTLQWLVDDIAPGETLQKPMDRSTSTASAMTLGQHEALGNENFQSWRDSGKGSCLLVTAGPGKGKSVLSNFVLQHLEQKALRDRLSNKIVYYFCNTRHEKTEQSPEAVLRSLVVQLCENEPGLLELLKNYELHQENWRNLWWKFLALCCASKSTEIYCIIDGLDVYYKESAADSEGGMESLVYKLVHFYDHALLDKHGKRKLDITFKLFCTSRPNIAIQRRWGDKPIVQLRPSKHDLTLYIENRVQALPREFTQTMKNTIRTELRSQHGRTFLWMSIVLRTLATMEDPTINNVQLRLKDTVSLPELSHLYQAIIDEAVRRSPQNIRILAFVVYAFRPMTLPELRAASAIDPRHGGLTRTEYQLSRNMTALDGEVLHNRLGALLDTVGSEVFVIHQSFREYVATMSTLTLHLHIGAQQYLAWSCIQLACIAFKEIDFGSIDDMRPFRYAVDSWHAHVNSAKVLDAAHINLIKQICECSKFEWYVRQTVYQWSYQKFAPLSRFILYHDLDWLLGLLIEDKLPEHLQVNLGSPDLEFLRQAERHSPKVFALLSRLRGDSGKQDASSGSSKMSAWKTAFQRHPRNRSALTSQPNQTVRAYGNFAPLGRRAMRTQSFHRNQPTPEDAGERSPLITINPLGSVAEGVGDPTGRSDGQVEGYLTHLMVLFGWTMIILFGISALALVLLLVYK